MTSPLGEDTVMGDELPGFGADYFIYEDFGEDSRDDDEDMEGESIGHADENA
jgi:hypothetical protein